MGQIFTQGVFRAIDQLVARMRRREGRGKNAITLMARALARVERARRCLRPGPLLSPAAVKCWN
jgi:hypothetical protein